MMVLQPAWLILLAPWVALVVMCLREFRPKVVVPFLDLWPAESPGESKQRFWQMPPWPIVLLLLSLLLMIGALAQPAMRRDRPALREMTVVVDRGVTMLAGDRLGRAAESLAVASEGIVAPEATIRVVGVGEGVVTSPAGLRDAVGNSATAMQVQAQVRALASGQREGGAIVLVSDMANPPAGVIACEPAGIPENVGIVSAVVNQGKCLLILRNDSSRTSAHVKLACAGGRLVEQDVTLPGRGERKSYVLEVPSELLRVTLGERDDLEDDNVRWLLPRPCAALALSAGLPQRVQRFAQSYAEARAGWPASGALRVTGWENLPESDAIIVAPGREMAKPAGSVWPEHPVLRDVKLSAIALAAGDEAMRSARAAGWRVLVGTSERPLVAVDDEHQRAWIGFEPAREEDVADWLILLTNVADHLAATSHTTGAPRRLGEGWRRVEPVAQTAGEAGTRYGVYQRGDELVAINVDAPALRECAAADIRGALLARAQEQSRVNLSRWLWLAAAVLGATAVALMTKRSA